MQQIEIASIPNQRLTFITGGVMWDISIKQTHGCMSVDMICGGVTLATGQRIVAGALFLPYYKLWRNGNFIIETEDDDLPHYTKFGVSQFMYYVSKSELDNLPMTYWPEKRLPVT